MMVFRNRPGAVVRYADPALQCQTQLLGMPDDSRIGFDNQRSIVTRLTVSQAVNVQFLHALGNLIYVYAFGDRIGQVGLSGLAFACECPDGADLGAERILTWYRQNRASRRPDPIKMTIGRAVIEGFVTAVNEDVIETSMNLVQWSITMMALPEDD